MSMLTRIKLLLPALVMALCLCLPVNAHAADGLPGSFDTCATNGGNAANPPVTFGDSDYTAKVVYCVQYTVQQAVTTLLTKLSDSMKTTVTIMFVLALVAFGIRGLSNAREMRARTPAFLIRLGMVGLFAYNLGGFSNSVFNVEQQLLNLVVTPLSGATGYTPWKQIDAFFGMIIGFAPCIVLAQGLLGIIVAALFSSTVGISVALSGIMMVIEVVLFIFDVVYVYLMAMLVIGFQIAISPLIIPLGIYFYTEKYVIKWLDMLIAAMITPVLLFAFLNLFLGIFIILLVNILTIMGATCPALPAFPAVPAANYNLCGCNIDFHTFWRPDVPFGTWMVPSEPNFQDNVSKIVKDKLNNGRIMPAYSAANNSLLHLAGNFNPLTVPKLDFGSFSNALQDWDVKSQLAFAFVALWLFASVMKSIVLRIPQIAESIAASVSGISFQPSPLTKLVKGEGDYDKFDTQLSNETLHKGIGT